MQEPKQTWLVRIKDFSCDGYAKRVCGFYNVRNPGDHARSDAGYLDLLDTWPLRQLIQVIFVNPIQPGKFVVYPGGRNYS
jgi:hypothetical protein